jgi:hypothetical protein
MRRFVILLAVLLVLGGVVFYFGWIQIRVPSGHHGVIFSRTSGWEDEPIEPGTFVWRWQALIPTNLTLHTFEITPHRTDVRLEGTLPSGPEIDALLDDGGDFSYEIRVTVATQLRPDRLPSLARDDGLRPEDLDDYYDDIDARIGQTTIEAVMSLVEDEPAALDVTRVFSSVVERITDRLDREMPELEITGITPQRLELPDIELYETARRLAADVLRARSTAMQEAAARLADTQASSDRSLALLKRYGEILDEYPVLLDYFRVGKEIGSDPLNLEEIIPETSR